MSTISLSCLHFIFIFAHIPLYFSFIFIVAKCHINPAQVYSYMNLMRFIKIIFVAHRPKYYMRLVRFKWNSNPFSLYIGFNNEFTIIDKNSTVIMSPWCGYNDFCNKRSYNFLVAKWTLSFTGKHINLTKSSYVWQPSQIVKWAVPSTVCLCEFVSVSVATFTLTNKTLLHMKIYRKNNNNHNNHILHSNWIHNKKQYAMTLMNIPLFCLKQNRSMTAISHSKANRRLIAYGGIWSTRTLIFNGCRNIGRPIDSSWHLIWFKSKHRRTQTHWQS